MMGWVLLKRADCELCEEFASDLARWSVGRSLPPLRSIDVDSDPTWRRRYGLRIPVLLWDGELACATRFDAAELERLLRGIR